MVRMPLLVGAVGDEADGVGSAKSTSRSASGDSDGTCVVVALLL
jgi:hypothetical protein